MKNIYYALFLSIVVISWMAVGQLSSTSEASETETLELSNNDNSQSESLDKHGSTKSKAKEAIRVEVELQNVQAIAEKLEVSGHTEPNKTLHLRAELSGKSLNQWAEDVLNRATHDGQPA